MKPTAPRDHERSIPGPIQEAMRDALRALGTIAGQVGAEDMLDWIFRQFRIGK